jgi:hypothetical protein
MDFKAQRSVDVAAADDHTAAAARELHGSRSDPSCTAGISALLRDSDRRIARNALT